VRETFEETGILLARFTAVPPDADRRALWRHELLEDRATLASLLRALNAVPDLRDMVYFAHWITPLAEPRRFDTRFFAVATPAGAEAVPDAREMSDAQWVSPARALQQFEAGALPMVFPTLHTLRMLQEFETVAEVLTTLRTRAVRTIMPRLVRTEGGVGIVIDEGE
jgi:8-oxo-dGTP pyrophosphatase MutT (NUDIX family)